MKLAKQHEKWELPPNVLSSIADSILTIFKREFPNDLFHEDAQLGCKFSVIFFAFFAFFFGLCGVGQKTYLAHNNTPPKHIFVVLIVC